MMKSEQCSRCSRRCRADALQGGSLLGSCQPAKRRAFPKHAFQIIGCYQRTIMSRSQSERSIPASTSRLRTGHLMRKTRNITVAVSERNYTKVRIHAARHNTSVSALVGFILEHLPVLSPLTLPRSPEASRRRESVPRKTPTHLRGAACSSPPRCAYCPPALPATASLRRILVRPGRTLQ